MLAPRSLLSLPLLALALATAACGGSQKPADAPDAEASSDAPESGGEETAGAADGDGAGEGKSAEAAASGPVTLPTECHKSSGPCMPSPAFVKRLCNSRNPSVAVYLFGNGSKWERGYLTRKTEAWNASGGASAEGYLEFDEEVLLLFARKSDLGGMQVSGGGGGGYDALRWDGSCVTLSNEEVTSQRPPSPKSPKVEWRFLDDNIQEGLRKDDNVNQAYLTRRKECKGAVSGDVSLKCVKADQALTDALVRFVRGGGSVPVPTTLPE